ncbi:sugar ABC transporter substrate-binding protein [Microbacterium sp.]|uniref:sugar ABC transporter substrate-binding protein n=1 Tax=Microbacterium sp. TaxID=51671 RepID=UPI0039E57BE1
MRNPLVVGIVAAAALAISLTGCAADDPPVSSGGEITIAWISPDATSSARWEEKDWPAFQKAVREIDPEAKLIQSTAASETEMLQQAEAAVTQGATVIVVNPITSDGALPIADLAKRENVSLIAYEGLIEGADLDGYITFNNEKVGELQAQYIVDHAGEDPTIAIMNGAQVCTACIAFKTGAHKVFDPLVDAGDITIGYEADTPDWLTANAQTQTEQALTALKDDVHAVLAANDGLAQGVIAALKARDLNGKVIVTGQDATTAGLQEILLGNQTMTVYKDFNIQAQAAAKAAVALARGDSDTGLTDQYDNEGKKVPALFLDPITLDRSNIARVIDDGFITREELCSGEAAASCDF